MSLVHNEQTKLRATYLNGLAIALFAVGGLTPLFSGLYGTVPAQLPYWIIVIVSFLCFGASMLLHLRASRVLEDLRE
jgi:putative Ca2+/H+ antiporter (TMEM165/GDT1 family)